MRAALNAITALVAIAACSSSGVTPGSNNSMHATGSAGTAIVRDAAGRQLGTLALMDMAEGLMATGTLRGLPRGTHGIHLHTTGRCEAPFTSAGPHWNPTAAQHGLQNPQGAHLGDMPNIVADADGVAMVNVTTRGGSLRGSNGALDADGASVVIHAAADDHRTDPSGNSGERIACGEVRAAAP